MDEKDYGKIKPEHKITRIVKVICHKNHFPYHQ